jgi:hypothetical protein
VKSSLSLVVVVLIFALMFLSFWLASSRLWRAVGSAKVIYNGQRLDASKVYRSSNGDILLRLISPDENSAYIFYPEKKLIGIPNAGQFIYLSMYAFSIDQSPPVVMSNDRIKIERDMNLIIIDNDVFEFTSLNGGRVRVVLKGSF